MIRSYLINRSLLSPAACRRPCLRRQSAARDAHILATPNLAVTHPRPPLPTTPALSTSVRGHATSPVLSQQDSPIGRNVRSSRLSRQLAAAKEAAKARNKKAPNSNQKARVSPQAGAKDKTDDAAPAAQHGPTSRSEDIQEAPPHDHSVLQDAQPMHLPDPIVIAELIAAVDKVVRAFLAQMGDPVVSIPTQETTLKALRACAQHITPVNYTGPEPQLLELDKSPQSAGRQLLGVDDASEQGENTAVEARLGLEDLNDRIAEATFTIIRHPYVHITPVLLREYVDIHTRLAMPETFPHVFELYTWKPRARLVRRTVQLKKRWQHNPSNAVSRDLADKALDVALHCKNMDACIGIIENTHGTLAFQIHKWFTKALLPLTIWMSAFPLVISPVAAAGAELLNLQADPWVYNRNWFIGLCVYYTVTSSLGLIAFLTWNDHHRRVYWRTGTPLVHRWLREDERAAMDKVVCTFGFSAALEHRFGEEKSEEYALLKAWCMQRGFWVDPVPMMDGMG